MARRVATRMKIEGELVAYSPLHIGGMGGNVDTDLALAVDGRNKFYFPGTSLAGPLRAWVWARAKDSEACKRLFGYQERKNNEQTQEERNEGEASHIFIEDGPVMKGGREIGPEEIEIRDGVGIDRLTGAAAENMKFDRAILPYGSRIRLQMTVDLIDPATRDDDKRLIRSLLEALQNGKIRFGAAGSRGLGLVRLDPESVKIFEQKLLTPEGILNALRKSRNVEPKKLSDLGEPAMLLDRPAMMITIKWRPRGPLMVKAERDGVGVDILPLTSAIDEQLSFVIPGSSIKGALRSVGERIVRTVRGFNAPTAGDSKEIFIDQLAMKRANDKGETEGQDAIAAQLVSYLFGKSADEERDSRNSDDRMLPPLPGLSALTVEDCYADPRFTQELWAMVEQANSETQPGEDQSELQKLLAQADEKGRLKEMQIAMHVAVDRWTGGAADGFLFSVLEPHGISWQDIRLKLDLSRMPADMRWPAVAYLLLILRDLANGRIPLGFGANRGMGAIAVDRIEIETEDINDDDLKFLEGLTFVDGKLVGMNEALKTKINSSWTEWISSGIDTIQGGSNQ